MDKQTEKEIIENLQRLIRIESVKDTPVPGMPFGRGVGEALSFYLDTAAGMGLKTKNYDGYAGEVILPAAGKNGGAAESLAVLVHLDVVPAGEGWSAPPFSGEIRDGRIYGRGATDDKGAAVVCLYALKKLLDEKAALSKDIRLIAGCDEESGQQCMKYYKANAVMPETGFSPDADFPVINCEKTILQLKLAIPADKAFKELVKETDSGGRPNVIPDKASAVLTTGETLSFTGKAAHAMAPQEGDNALFKLINALLKKAGKGKSAALGFMAARLCDYSGAGLGINAADEKSGALTMNFASLKLEGDFLRAVLDFRCPLSVDTDTVIKTINAHMPAGGGVEVLYLQPGLYVSPDSALVRTLMRSYEKATGKKGECVISGGGTYARHLKQGVAFGPSENNAENNIHSADEFVEIKQLGIMFDIYYDAIKELANGR